MIPVSAASYTAMPKLPGDKRSRVAVRATNSACAVQAAIPARDRALSGPKLLKVPSASASNSSRPSSGSPMRSLTTSTGSRLAMSRTASNSPKARAAPASSRARRWICGTIARSDLGPIRSMSTLRSTSIAEQAAIGFDSVKLLLSNDDVFFEGGSMVTQYSPEEAAAAGEQARESGVWLNCHAQNPSSIKLAVRNGFRSVYHCSYADAETIDLLDEAKDSIFLSPAVGIMWANVYEGEEFGIDRAMAERIGSVRSLEAMTVLYPELRRRGLRVLPGGDYGFPNNPIGRNARDLELFVRLFGYTPLEALRAATYYGGQVLDMPVGLLTPGYLADLLVVSGSPATDVTVLQDPENLLAIMQGGQFHKRAERLVPAAP